MNLLERLEAEQNSLDPKALGSEAANRRWAELECEIDRLRWMDFVDAELELRMQKAIAKLGFRQ